MPRAPRPHVPMNKKTRRSRRPMLVGAAVSIALSLAAGDAAAETAITVYSDQARVMAMKGQPATAIVGNPMFADASIRPGMIVIHGRHFGTTNIVVLDNAGNELADFQVTVVQSPATRVTIYQAGGPITYTCGSNCETTLEVGDAPEQFKRIQEAMSSKYGLATNASQMAKQ